MDEILLDEQLRTQLSLQDQPVAITQAQQQQNRKRKVKKASQQNAAKPSGEPVDVSESLKNEIEYMPNTMKTPISILQELLSRRGITPNYELVQIEGAVHQPSFRYRVSFNDKDAMGVGRSKKEAKHAAAKALIDKLTGTNISDQFYQQKSNFNANGSSTAQSNSSATFDENNQMGNPIGVLQELCMQKHWPAPKYEVEVEIGLPHERQFTIACTVLKFREVGTGKSKKIAKRQAAQKMWERLQNQTLDQTEVIQACIDDANDEEANIPTLTNQHSYKVSQFHKMLKNMYGKSLAKLQNTCLNAKDVNYVVFLQEIATEHQFEVTYVDIEEKTNSGRYQCLVQLSTLPVAVCQGAGANSKDAQSNAAKNALEYLKIMSKV
ncbi:protein Loquacious isoform X2 [Chironomus tepperi]|uniref:protein Loquacious isoform X2 n=1 Tax=Chironomus tepperi TaxID=113505 RepID=UPI00391FA7A8